MGDFKIDGKAEPDVPFCFYEQAEAVKPLLKPPVGNHLIFGQAEQLKVMFIGGPNQRPDYHINEGEELFFQLKGPLDLKIVEHNQPKVVRVEEGQMFCLPPRVPHSPQRYADTCGLVIERERLSTETDALRWFIEEDGSKLDQNGLKILYVYHNRYQHYSYSNFFTLII
jgi:3-hydroxyanthranilate 3,4-dioxygenase